LLFPFGLSFVSGAIFKRSLRVACLEYSFKLGKLYAARGIPLNFAFYLFIFSALPALPAFQGDVGA
jgi:hypothetical protein